jgi:translation initiation factor 1
MSRKKDAPGDRSGGTPFNNPFGALKEKRPDLPQSSVSERAPPSKERKGPARAVVRYERKGRGGKEVTVVEQLGLPERGLEEWLNALKQALGCGGWVEDAALVFQGDQRVRLLPLLTARGVRSVTVSG